MTIAFVLNGQNVSVDAGHPHALAALRDELGVTSPKDGCSPSGQCGCCTVLLDGKAMVSCVTAVEKLDGKEVVTLEGFDSAERDRYASAFAAKGALQCGFCTPGIVVRAKALIDQKGSALDRKTIEGRLGAHLCRCTGYTKIIEAIELLASGDEIPTTALPTGLGQSGAKYEAQELALGDRGYVDDLTETGMLHGFLRLTDHARADVLAIDTNKALALPGVVAVFTAEDVPGDIRVGIIDKDWPVFVPVGGRTSYSGDVLAIVVAETARIAQEATDLIEVDYHLQVPITDPVLALQTDEVATWGQETNLLSRSAYTRGDFESAHANAAHTIHEVFHTQRVEHAFLEPESTLAVPSDDGSIHVY